MMTEQELTTIEMNLDIVETHEVGHEMLFRVVPDLIAEIRRLQKERADAPIVYNMVDKSGQIDYVDFWHMNVSEEHRGSSARLVEIKKIGEGE